MKYEFTAKGKTDFEDPKSWARSASTVTLVEKVYRTVDADKLTDKERARVNRWCALGWCKRSGEVEQAKKPAAKKKTKKRTPAKPKAEKQADQSLAA